ncbi:MAG: class I SAM-dependent methyltransferase [Ferruginibacter sp.]|nr:class I SAM-dependent methyltransferase [Ferruginibacter sp.]
MLTHSRCGRKNKRAGIPLSYFSLFITHLYTHFQLAKKYLRYYLSASSGKGHGVHSPFVFDLIKNVLRDKKKYGCYTEIELQREKLTLNKSLIEVADFGAGSTLIKTNRRMVKHIANSSLKPKKYAQLLFRMVQYYKPATIIELGTSFGITSAYLSFGNTNAQLFTCEGANSIAAIAQETFRSLQIKNIEMIRGDFAKTLPPLLQKIKAPDFVFIDGNHRKGPTLQYFQQLLNHSTTSTILVFDDIHWSAEMEAAWSVIQQHPAVTLTVDLFFIGLVFINPDFKVKQHFTIRF